MCTQWNFPFHSLWTYGFQNCEVKLQTGKQLESKSRSVKIVKNFFVTRLYLYVENKAVLLKEKYAYEGRILTSCFDLFLSSPVSYIS